MSSLYFLPTDIEFFRNFPGYISNHINLGRFSETHWDWFEATTPATFCMPLELLLACIGLSSFFKTKDNLRLLIPVLSTAACFPVMLAFNSASQRYEQEFFPFFTLTNIMGLLFISNLTIKTNTLRPGFRLPFLQPHMIINGAKKFVLVALLVLGMISIYQSLAITYNEQRNNKFLIDSERRIELKTYGQNIDNEIGVIKAEIKNFRLRW